MVLGLPGGIQAKASGLVLDMAHQSPLGTIPLVGSDHKDFSRFKNHGTPTNITTTVLPSGLAVATFDLGSSVGCGDAPSLDITAFPFTLEAWTKSECTTSGQIIGKWLTDIHHTNYNLTLYGIALEVRFSFGDNTNYRFYNTTSAIPSTWTHVVGVAVSSTDMKIYFNAVSQALSAGGGAATTPAANAASVKIGAGYANYKGGIAFQRIHKGIGLSEEEVGKHYTAEKRFFGL